MLSDGARLDGTARIGVSRTVVPAPMRCMFTATAFFGCLAGALGLATTGAAAFVTTGAAVGVTGWVVVWLGWLLTAGAAVGVDCAAPIRASTAHSPQATAARYHSRRPFSPRTDANVQRLF